MPILRKKDPQIWLKDLQVKVKPNRTETSCLEVFEKDGPNLVIRVGCELMDLLYLNLPLLKDLAERVEVLVMLILLLVAEIAHDVSKTDMQLLVSWGYCLKCADLEVLLQKCVVLSLQAIL